MDRVALVAVNDSKIEMNASQREKEKWKKKKKINEIHLPYLCIKNLLFFVHLFKPQLPPNDAEFISLENCI